MQTSPHHTLQQSSASQTSQSEKSAEPLTMYDLPSEFVGEPGLPDEYHDLQPELLSATLRLTQYTAQERFTGTDMCLYYDDAHPLWHKRPDWFLAVGVPRLYKGSDLRLSYVVKDEGVAPSVIVELLSPGTEQQDLGPFYRSSDRIDPAIPKRREIDADLGEGLLPKDTALVDTVPQEDEFPTSVNPKAAMTPPSKWTVYEDILKVPYYITYSRYSDTLRCFQLSESKYVEAELDPDNPRFWLDALQIGIGIWQGEYKGGTRSWLRWFDANGQWILTEAESERLRADEERRLRLELLEQLKQKGIDIDTLWNNVSKATPKPVC